jgi:hypothetical protein
MATPMIDLPIERIAKIARSNHRQVGHDHEIPPELEEQSAMLHLTYHVYDVDGLGQAAAEIDVTEAIIAAGCGVLWNSGI